MCANRTEPQIFKTKFIGWDDVIPVDYTRTAESVIRRGADMKVIMERDKMQTDLSALFMPRQPTMPPEEAVSSHYGRTNQLVGHTFIRAACGSVGLS